MKPRRRVVAQARVLRERDRSKSAYGLHRDLELAVLARNRLDQPLVNRLEVGIIEPSNEKAEGGQLF